MDHAELERRARALYESRPLQHAPSWNQLSEVTRGVWHEYVLQGQDQQAEDRRPPGASSNNQGNQ